MYQLGSLLRLLQVMVDTTALRCKRRLMSLRVPISIVNEGIIRDRSTGA